MMSVESPNPRYDVDRASYHLAENLSYTVCSNPGALSTSLNVSGGSIHDKLLGLYIKHFTQSKHTTFSSNPRACPNLLSMLVKRDKLNTLVISLKPLDQGYSILLKSLAGNLVETINLPYTERDLLDYIEQEEIPHNLVDLLEQTQSDLFYDGCVIAEIRDSRRSVNGAYKTSYVLLKPSHRSILADINALTNDQFRWTQDDRFILESKLLLATSEPLCLDPTPTVGIIRNRLAYKKKVAQTEHLKRSMRPYTAKGVLKRRTYAKLSCRKELPILAFLQARGSKSKYSHPRDSHIRTSVVDSWKTHSAELSPVNTSNVQMLAKELEKPQSYHHSSSSANKQLTTDCTPIVVEEYTMETERPVGKLHRSRLIILKKPSEDRFIGELYIDRSEWSSNKCVFELGTAPLKDKYINQFIEIFTEEGRRQVKIAHTLPGQDPKVVYTSGANGQVTLSQGSTTPSSSQNLVYISTSSTSASNQSPARLSTESQSAIRLSSENRSAIRFSLSAQPGLSASIHSQADSSLAAQSMSSTDSSGASLMLGRQGLKIQGGILPSPQTPQPVDQSVAGTVERSLSKDRLTPAQTMKAAAASVGKQTSLANVGGLGKATLLMSRSGTQAQLAQLSTSQTHKLIGIQTSTPSSSTIGLHNIAGLQTVQGLHNVQVSLTSLGQGGIAVPVSLIGGISGNQPIFLSGPLSMMEARGSSQQTSTAGQSSATVVQASHRPLVMTTQAGGNQQLIAGHQGLITLPVTSTLAQQILAANKQRQNSQQQHLNIVNAQQLSGQQISSQILTNQQTPQQGTNIKQTSIQLGQLLANQQGPIQISHLSSNQQSPNVQIGHQIITQNAGNLQVRPSQSSALRASTMQVFHQPTPLQTPQQSTVQRTPQHINIITSNQSGQSSLSGGQQVLHIPQNIAISHTGQAGHQLRMATPSQPQQQKILFRQIGSSTIDEYHQSPP